MDGTHPREIIIRDSLYSRVPVEPHALSIMASPEFLRLQKVKQLGWVFVVWPGATHTRYEHSLGVYHLTRRALAALTALGPHAGLDNPPASELDAVLAAALLHDVGHYPYSHGIEELGRPVAPHEHNAAKIITGTTIAPLLAAWSVDPEDVVELIAPTRPAKGRWRVYRSLLSGALDMDKLDYLPRDARACNVPYGGVDVDRLLDSLRVLSDPAGPRLAIDDKGISPLHSLIRARQEMFDNVYWHHTNRACMAMLLRAVQDAVDAGVLEAGDLAGHDDWTLLALLAKPNMPSSTRALVGLLSARRVHKRAVEFSARSGDIFSRLNFLFYDPARRKRAELALRDATAAATGLHIAAHEILIDVPKPERWEVDVPVCFNRPPHGLEPVMQWSDATGMQPHDLAAYETHQRRIRIVAVERLHDRLYAMRESVVLPTLGTFLSGT